MICANSTRYPSPTAGRLIVWAAMGVAASTLAFASVAQAADVSDDFLRGAFAPPPVKPYYSWEGPYLGADLGYSQMRSDFSDSAGSMVHDLLRTTTIENEGHVSDWPLLKGSGSGNIWGAFVGYNWQMTDLVMGIEGAYHMPSKPMRASATDSIARVFGTSDGTSNAVTIDSSGRLELRDYGTVRGRVGYVFGQFMPYAGLGLSIARVSYTTTVNVQVSQNGGAVIPFAQTISKRNEVAYGANLSAGVDVTLLPNLFLRGEYEYVGFAPTDGIRTQISTFRVGLGLKF